eukprot:CAMPEP_0117813668 /NCGR_PEP_ID=MMETSP0948-20121206/23656_1 /TAXON_ID=44440 /ORGANISM="Chattonella subsalsa, Strain CCMP2191" /LENGTH=79 /DNA_ID=CAMNT_0005651089 /DNA_START=259 /DNA_END=495 /DNA_ORIENTATION=-
MRSRLTLPIKILILFGLFAEGKAGGWAQTSKLLSSDAVSSDKFGSSVSWLSSTVAIVGAHFDDDGGSNSGSAYIFTWSE